jgi:hypothetical protein
MRNKSNLPYNRKVALTGSIQMVIHVVILDDPDIDASLEEMGCIGMALMPSSELCRVGSLCVCNVLELQPEAKRRNPSYSA